MPRGSRRPPPSALRLVTGPAPPRSAPKHTMPSVPRPAFHPPCVVSRGSVPYGRQITTQPQPGLMLSPLDHQLPPPFLYDTNSPSSASTTPTSSPLSSKIMRGPWDHSGSIVVPIDLHNVLTPLKPVAVSPGGR